MAVTGANRGIGLALATELTQAGAEVVALIRSSSDELEALKPAEIVKNIDVTDDKKCESIKDQITGGPIDIVSKKGWESTSADNFTCIHFFIAQKSNIKQSHTTLYCD